MLRSVHFALACFAAALLASPSAAAPVKAPVKPPSSAKVVRPLVMTVTRHINWGTVVIKDPIADFALVDMDQKGTLRLCHPELVCSGAFQSAQFNIQGTKGAQVRFIARRSTLTNTTSGLGETIVYQPGFNATHTLIHNGAPGIFVDVGGFIMLTPTTTDGMYVGQMDVIVDYL